MVRRMMLIVVWLIAAAVLCGDPQRCLADDAAGKKDRKAEETKQNKEEAKDGNNEGDIRDGVNRAYDEFKKETTKGKKNLSDLYEREKARSREGTEK